MLMRCLLLRCATTTIVLLVGVGVAAFAQKPDPTQALVEFEGHTNVAAAVCFSPDGRHVISGSWDETVRLWDAQAGTPLQAWKEPTDWIETVAVYGDGTKVCAASQRAAHVWSLETWRHEATYPFRNARSCSVVALSKDGQWLACGVRNGTVTVWEVGEHHPRWTLTTDAAWTRCLAFSLDGKRLAAGSWLGHIRIWDLSAGREVQSFPGHVDAVASAACFSPDGKELATGGYDATIKRWDVLTGELKSEWSDHKGLVLSLAYSPDGRLLASGERHGPIKLWNVATQELLLTYKGHPDPKLGFSVTALDFSPDSRFLVSAGYDKAVRRWLVPDR